VKNLKNSKVGIITLGCVRNLVDSQAILGRLKNRGCRIVDVQDADIVILNTCSFIEDARRESIDTILDLIDLKKQGKIKKIILAGCLPQRYKAELVSEFKEVDALVGIQPFLQEHIPDQVYLTPRHFAYVKICESCYNHCHFCAIPSIKGKFSSRTIESILHEVKQLDKNGVKEINIVGQDITAYGMDIYHEKKLAVLLKEMTKGMTRIEWVRLLYTFPAHMTEELIDVIAQEDKICKYIDLPLQHISDKLLKSMNRKMTARQTRELIQKIRKRIPGVRFRTAFIVGLPSETEKDFEELVSFVRQMRFEKVGVFKYSREEGTPAFDMPHQVPEKVKEKRFDRLMQEQQKISESIHQELIGSTLKVLVEERQEENRNIYLGRSEYDAPDVDGLVTIHSSRDLKLGDFADVKIIGSSEYDLIAEA